MGLFVAQDGYYQGWLAALLCCVAALGEDEHPVERHSRPTTRTGVCQQQPPPLTTLPKTPTADSPIQFKGDDPLYPPARHNVMESTPQVPSLKPLQLGDGFLRTPRTAHWQQASSSSQLGRPVAEMSSSSRRVEHTDGQRATLVPLRLGPVVLASTPDDSSDALPTVIPVVANSSRRRSESTQGLLLQSKRESYRAQRETPFQRCQQISTTALSSKTSASSFDSAGSTVSNAPTTEQRVSRPPISRGSSSNSLHRQALEARATSSEHSRLKRKRSLQNVRATSVELDERRVEREVLELNTIVEERRAEQPRPQSPPGHHIAAVAPAMQVHARSETLNDIGSALARPFTAQDQHRIMAVFDSPEKPTRPSTSRASSRVSGWLSGLFPTAASSTHAASQEPFYKCMPPTRQRAYSETSLGTFLASDTDLTAPSLTAASSPTTKGHSRSLTAESRMTPISPSSTVYDHALPDVKRDAEEHWPIQISKSQVGLAL